MQRRRPTEFSSSGCFLRLRECATLLDAETEGDALWLLMTMIIVIVIVVVTVDL